MVTIALAPRCYAVGDRVRLVEEGKFGTIEKTLYNRIGTIAYAVLNMDGGYGRRVVAIDKIAPRGRA
jgi:hypothetical protein